MADSLTSSFSFISFFSRARFQLSFSKIRFPFIFDVPLKNNDRLFPPFNEKPRATTERRRRDAGHHFPHYIMSLSLPPFSLPPLFFFRSLARKDQGGIESSPSSIYTRRTTGACSVFNNKPRKNNQPFFLLTNV